MPTPQILGDPEEIRQSIQLPPLGNATFDRQEGDAEKRRQQAFDSVPHWKGRPLEPFSISREALFVQLRTAAGAAPFQTVLQDGEAWYADAIRLLWICSHTPEAWEDLRGEPLRLQSVIDRWADANLDSRRDKHDLVLLTLRLWNESQVNMHVPAADPDGKDREPGN